MTCLDSTHLERQVSSTSRDNTFFFMEIWGPACTIRTTRWCAWEVGLAAGTGSSSVV